MATIAGCVLFAIGSFFTFANFYLSFIRYLVYRWRGGELEDYRFISGIPLFGSLILWFSAGLLHEYPTLMWSAIVVSVFDTGGIHWFAGTMLWYSLFQSKPH
jgi:hypothetical protein